MSLVARLARGPRRPVGAEDLASNTRVITAANPMPAMAGIDRKWNFQTHTVEHGTSAEQENVTESGNRSTR